MDVFSQLPEDIKKEILCSPQTGTAHSKTTKPSPCSKGIQSFFRKANARYPSTPYIPEMPMHKGGGDAPLTVKHSSSKVADDGSTCIPHPNPISEFRASDMDCVGSSDSSTGSFFPRSVDMNVFSQLPEDLQKELMTDWKHKDLTPKIPAVKSQEKAKYAKLKSPGQRPNSSANPNNLLKYFKPG